MTGTHKHQCKQCQHVWEHSNNCAGNRNAHTCSQCGEMQWDRHYADEDLSKLSGDELFFFAMDRIAAAMRQKNGRA